MKIITINVPKTYLKAIEYLLEKRIYPSRSELLRVALRDFLKEEIKLVEAVEDKKKLNRIKTRPLTGVIKKYKKLKKDPVVVEEVTFIEDNGTIKYRIIGEA